MARKKNPVVVNLSDEFQISTIKDSYEEFVKAVNEDRPIMVDMSQVNIVDYAGLQLLCSLKRSCKEKELDFSLTNVSEVVEQKMGLCGLGFLKDGENGSV